jgi:hypothetical protein
MAITKSSYDKIIAVYPELLDYKLAYKAMTLRNDSDGIGEYIESWTYDKPLPAGLVVGKPAQ